MGMARATHILIGLLVCLPLLAESHDAKAPPESGKPRLVAGLGTAHHPVSTKRALAQRYFDQGMRYLFAFNHSDAVRSFERATELDPQLAMGYWGVALALGPNINDDITAESERKALAALVRAQALSGNASEAEKAYIAALAQRYSADEKSDRAALNDAYHKAMVELARRYPADLDAAVLYAESGMDLRPWKLWTADGKPEPGTEEVVAVLESVLARDPNHVGAIHYYMHAVEASPDPGRALPYARRLAALAPAAGHLVHMPAHIYVRVGEYRAAARSNEAAIRDDRAMVRLGVKPAYAAHNIHFLAYSEAMAGNYRAARAASDLLVRSLTRTRLNLTDADPYLATPFLIDVKFSRWPTILVAPEPDFELQQTAVIWHFARGMAYAATGAAELAQSELEALRKAQETLPKDALASLNDARAVFRVADAMLDARIAQARGQDALAIEALKRAVAAEDALAYDEPPGWYLPSREALGAAYYRQGDYAAAERTFRDDLARNPGNPRSLFGLAAALQAEGRVSEAAVTRTAFSAAWRGADTRLVLPAP